MKKTLLIYICIFFCLKTAAQNVYLTAKGATKTETATIDSIGYAKVHPNAKSLKTETERLVTQLYAAGFFESQISANIKLNDSTYLFQYKLGSRIANIKVQTKLLSKSEKDLLNITEDTINLSPAGIENFMAGKLTLLEQKGYALSQLQLTNYTRKNNTLNTTLQITLEKKRSVDNLVIEGYPKFPESIRRNILKQYKKKPFNKDNIQKIYQTFNNLRFVSLPRYPEILFKQDTTTIYVYAQKANANTFDGFIGFSNDEQQKLKLNGYLDLTLINTLNSGEKFNLYWKNNGQKQSTFNTSLELPYIFKSPIGIKGDLQIFRQDSTFQNTVSNINLAYYFKYNTKLLLGRSATTSVSTTQTDTNLSGYNSKFWTATYETAAYDNRYTFFPERYTLYIRYGNGKRDSDKGNSNQYFAQATADYNAPLNNKNLIYLKTQLYYLNSQNFVVNELQRFGGINSIRGFNENILQGDMYSFVMTEYRYIASENLCLHSIFDVGYYQDHATNQNNGLFSIGFGAKIFTSNGIFNIIYANGTEKSQHVKLSNSIVHVSFKTKF
ncbi:MAG: hypothetical protein ACOVRN_18970 [Flavobacterium sp.]